MRSLVNGLNLFFIAVGKLFDGFGGFVEHLLVGEDHGGMIY